MGPEDDEDTDTNDTGDSLSDFEDAIDDEIGGSDDEE